ncbi:DUF917 domain-containing protein [Pseudonocardiaceae bacterium YIM PH 21723]|nr:DUF917 domain-containing protein [Pseudonocardiaceae bacterium YIM PH 21723]
MTAPITRIEAEHIPTLQAGAQLLACGTGGGDWLVLSEWLRVVIERNGPLTVAQPEDLDPEGACAAVHMVGSPMLMEEQLPTGGELRLAIEALQRWTGRELTAIAPLNAAGPNALIPMIAAAELGLPLLDLDGMGRIFPLVDMTTYALGGLAPTPITLTGTAGEVILLDGPAGRLEGQLRPALLGCGGWACCASYPGTIGQFAATGIPGSVSRVLHAGRVLRREHGLAEDGFARQLGGRSLAVGQIVDVERHQTDRTWTDGSFPAGPSSVIIGESGGHGRMIRLEIHNDILLALADGGVIASVPDGICLVSGIDRQPVDVEQLQLGMRVEVLVLPAASAWRSEAGMAVAGPAAFGLAHHVPTGLPR